MDFHLTHHRTWVKIEIMGDYLKQLIYTSEANEDMDFSVLESILDRARARNAELGITGMLLYSEGHFLQVLEGDAGVLDHLYAKIAADPRHDHVRTVVSRPIHERDFPDWSMGHRALSIADVRAHPAFNDFFNAGFDDRNISEFASPARFLLLAFRDM